MPISKTEALFSLIKSMTKAEKRSFRLYANRVQEDKELQYLRLFDILDKQKRLDEQEIREKLSHLNGSKYSNLKRHLYSQILISIRLLVKDKRPNIKIREHIDFAHILYGKGLYLQALDILAKAKKISIKHNTGFSSLIIVEIEKMIHSRHITRSKSEPIEKLLAEATALSSNVTNRVQLSNLKIMTHKFYVEHGHIKNEEELEMIKAYFEHNLKDLDSTNFGLLEKVYLNQCFVWYYYILNDFQRCKEYAHNWVNLFKSSKSWQTRDINLFLRGYHYLLTSCFNLRQTEEFTTHLKELESLRKSNYKSFNYNTQITSFLYTHSGRLNLHFLHGSFKEGLPIIKRTLARIRRYKNHLDEHKIMVLYFKISWMLIGNQMPRKAMEYLDSIINMTPKSLRTDIQCYTRLMYLMALYDDDQYGSILKKSKEFRIYFDSIEQKNEVQMLTLTLFIDIAKSPLLERKEICSKYFNLLKTLENSLYEKRAFMYIEILPWLQSKIERKSLAEIIKQRS